MDGVLVDNMRTHARAYDIFYERHGVGNRQNVLKELSGLGNDEIMQRLFTPERLAELGGWQALSEEKEAIYRELYEPLIRPTAGLLDFLEALRREGIACAVGSSAEMRNIRFVFEKCGIESYFQTVVSSEQVTRCKPDPEIYLKAAEAFRDSAPRSASYSKMPCAGIEAGDRAGMKVVALADDPVARRVGTDGRDARDRRLHADERRAVPVVFNLRSCCSARAYNNASNWRMGRLFGPRRVLFRSETLFAVMRAQGFVVYHAAQSFEDLHVGVAGERHAVAVVGEELLRRTRAGGDDRNAQRHRFADHQRSRLRFRRADKDVGRLHEGIRRLPEPQKTDGILQSQFVAQSFERRPPAPLRLRSETADDNRHP